MSVKKEPQELESDKISETESKEDIKEVKMQEAKSGYRFLMDKNTVFGRKEY